MSIKPISLSVCGLYILRALSLHAAEIPDSGQSLRESQTKFLPLPAPAVTPILHIDDKTSPRQSDSNERIVVRAFRITGNTVFSESELSTLVAHLISATRTLAELEVGAARITAYYRERGYIVARAYLPAQEIQSGVITIAILEGRINQVVINNQTFLSDVRIASYLDHIGKDTLIKAGAIDRALLLLADTPGVNTPNATLKPGASVGSSDLTIDVAPGALYDGRISIDNYGNRYTGQYRLNGLLNLNSLLKLGDQLSVNGIESDKDLSYWRIAWQVPVGGNGLTIGATYAYTTYQLGEEFSALNAHGSANTASLIATYPFLRTPATNVSGTCLLESRRLHDRVDSTDSVSDKQVKGISLGLNGTDQDRLGNANLVGLTLSHGQLSIDTDTALAIDAASSRTNGEYTKLTYTLSHLQRINRRDSVLASLSGQWANKNLNSSEKFSLGGIHGVRAYPEGEANGDEGGLLTVAYRSNLTESLQGSLFYDIGTVKINKTPFTITDNRRTLSGGGISMDAYLSRILIKTNIAWRDRGEPTSGPDRKPRFWMEAMWLSF